LFALDARGHGIVLLGHGNHFLVLAEILKSLTDQDVMHGLQCRRKCFRCDTVDGHPGGLEPVALATCCKDRHEQGGDRNQVPRHGRTFYRIISSFAKYLIIIRELVNQLSILRRPMSLDHVFEALSSTVRRKILAYLAATDLTAGEIAARFNISKPSISKHLSVLENAGLISSERKGQFI